ncbi:unnamed protein product [Penicillium camemberti]|uniref:Str. FM013 n=1 Tax=Penicillium camemberti (strain FM 013) TaxID=1429867 RepID=A0A0G4PRL8_PENC3|nr:unnamed protein product [Penicillium camemberti]
MSLPGDPPSHPRGSYSLTDQHQSTPATATVTPNSKQLSEGITQEELDLKPWKYIALQDNISCLEAELEDIDHLCSRQEVPDENNGSFRYDTCQERVKCIWRIKDALEKYNSFVLQYTNIKTRAAATERDIDSLRNWLYNHEGAIVAEEQSYINKDDLFPLIPKERSPLRRLFEMSSRFRMSRFWKRKSVTSDLPTHCHETIQLYSDERIDIFVTFTSVVIGLAMLIAPIWILAYTAPVAAKLAIITAFILLFLALVSFGTNAKPFESLAATAALEVGNKLLCADIILIHFDANRNFQS